MKDKNFFLLKDKTFFLQITLLFGNIFMLRENISIANKISWQGEHFLKTIWGEASEQKFLF